MTARALASRCDHVDGLTGATCIATSVSTLPIVDDTVDGSVAYCLTHYERAIRFAVGLEVMRQDEAELMRDAPVLAFPSVVSCPPNAGHAGTVQWALVERGNACPICGRYA